MKHAFYVGRVGALAVTLGVGAVWVTSPGIALAEDTGASTSSVQSTKRSSDRESRSGSGKAEAAGSDSSANEEDDSDADVDAPAGSEADDDLDEVVDGDDAEGLDDEPSQDDVAEPELAEDPDALSTHTDDPDDSALDVAGATVTVAGATVTDDDQPDLTTTETSVTDTAADVATPIPVPVTTTPVRLPAPTIGQVLTGLPASAVDAARGVIAIALSPLLIPSLFAPSTPADPPAFWVLLAWARRQLFNSTPRLRPQDAEADATTGEIVGDLGASDADGDPITLAVTRGPVHGTLTIDQEAGSYTYRPDAGYTGADSFVVTVTDSGPDGLFGFLLPGRGHVSAVEIRLTVPDTGGEEQPDFVIDSVDTRPVWGTGAVRGHVTASGIAELGDGPTRGSVVVNADGTFTYTPTPIQRAAAIYPYDEVTDTFTVAVLDAAGTTQTVVVTVPVSASGNALVYETPTQYGRPAIYRPVLDPLTGRIYVAVSADSRGGFQPKIALIAVNPDGTVIESGEFVPMDSFQVVINPVTGAGHLVGYDSDPVSMSAATTVVTIAADGTVQSVTAQGSPVGDLVFDASGNGYLVTGSGLSYFTNVLSVIAGDGTLQASRQLNARAEGAVANPARDVIYVFTQERGPLATVVNVVGENADFVESYRIEGVAAAGEMVINPVTGVAYQAVSEIPVPGQIQRSAVITHGPDGFDVSDFVAGWAKRTIVDPGAAGAAYLLLNSASGGRTIAVVAPDGTASTPEALPGEFSSAWFVGGRAVISTTAGTEVTMSLLDADGRLTTLPGSLRGTPVIDETAGRIYLTTEDSGVGTVWFVASTGAPVGVEIAGAAAEGPALDSAGRVLQAAIGAAGGSTLHAFTIDGRSIAEIAFQDPIVATPVVHPTDGAIYLYSAVGELSSRIVVLSSTLDILANHDVDGFRAVDGGSFELEDGARFIPNTVTGGAALLVSKRRPDSMLLDWALLVIGADGSTQVHELGGNAQSRASEEPRINPVTGVIYQVLDVATDDFTSAAGRVYSVFPDGASYVTDQLSGLAPTGGLVIDPETGTVFYRTEEGMWLVDVDPDRFV